MSIRDIALVACFLPQGQRLFEIPFGACEIRLLFQDLAHHVIVVVIVGHSGLEQD